ncbi:hypothetical protein L7F22_031487 [Adiantum nelumboides]|nr:hypothetical protein [Adiantum nelumboides]
MFSTSFKSFVLVAVALAAQAVAQKAGTVDKVGNSGISAQMMFLQSNNQVIIMDKIENNPVKRPGSNGPAAAVAYNTNTNKLQAMDVDHNPFCAGGMTLGDGTWVVVGGNKAVGAGGVTAQKNASPYYNYNGGRTVRLLSSCSGSGCSWDEKPNTMVKERWYATVEPMVDGHAMLISGMTNGGFVPSSGSQQTSYEFYPNVGGSYNLPLLQRTVPLSLYPLTFLMSSGEVWMQANKEAVLWNTDTLKEKRLPNTRVPRVYPASGAVMMLPLTPANNYQETILLCGGMSLGSAANWGNEGGPRPWSPRGPPRPSASKAARWSTPTGSRSTTCPLVGPWAPLSTCPTAPPGSATVSTTGVAGYTTDPNSPGKPSAPRLPTTPS